MLATTSVSVTEPTTDLAQALAGDAPAVVVFAVLIYHLVRAGSAHVAKILDQVREVIEILRTIRDTQAELRTLVTELRADTRYMSERRSGSGTRDDARRDGGPHPSSTRT